MLSASTIGEDSQKEVFISVYDLNTFTVVTTNPMQTRKTLVYAVGEAPDSSAKKKKFSS